ncbi:MAG: RluA family pseudouridine synthase [Thermoflexales bacterium]|nr:RluA family pseudouridine synthase [Thermoflexales bacterium]
MKPLHPRRIDVLYEDDDLIAVNKPAGVTTAHDAARPDELDLQALLEARFGRLWLVHRLDRDTSGIIVFARNEVAHRALSEQFEGRGVTKIYHALLVGNPTWTERTADIPLRVDGDRRHRTVVDVVCGKPAVTHFRVFQRLKRYALAEAIPETGRTHQIRVHAASLGHPIAADELYGDGKPIFLSQLKRDYRPSNSEELPLIGRVALHARRLKLTHPLTGAALDLLAPYAKDFNAAVKQLEKLT